MREDTRKKDGWTFSYDTECLVSKKRLLGTYFAIDVKPEAPRACKWTGPLPDADQPALTKAEVMQYAKTKVFKIRYDTKEPGPRFSFDGQAGERY